MYIYIYIYICIYIYIYLLPTGSEELEVLQTGSIHVAILPFCQSFTIVHLSALTVHLFG